MGGGLGGLNVVTRCGGGGGIRGTEDSLEGPVNGVASPGSMASSTTGPTTSLSRPPSLLTSTCDVNDPVSSFTCTSYQTSRLCFRRLLPSSRRLSRQLPLTRSRIFFSARKPRRTSYDQPRSINRQVHQEISYSRRTLFS